MEICAVPLPDVVGGFFGGVPVDGGVDGGFDGGFAAAFVGGV